MEAQFIAPGTSIDIAGHRITGGLIYVGRRLRAADGSPADPCLIDPSLMVARSMPDVSGNLMGYFPSYETLKPTSRLAYLRWLATGRRDQGYDVGYPFLFLYGLERALLVDRLTQHRGALLDEVKSLIQTYGHNNSFLTYASQLLESALLEAGVADLGQLTTRTGLELAIGAKIAAGAQVTPEDLVRFAVAAERPGTRFIRTCWEELLDCARPAMRTLPATIEQKHFTGRMAPFVKGASAAHQALKLNNLPAIVPILEESSFLREELRKIAKAAIKATREYQDLITINPALRGTEEALLLIVSTGPKPLDPALVAKKIAPWADDPFPASLSELNKDLPGLFGRKIDIKAMREGEGKLAPHGLALVPSALHGEITKADEETQVRVIRATCQNATVDLGTGWGQVARLAALANLIVPGKIEEVRLAAAISGLFPKLGAAARDRLPAFIWWEATKGRPASLNPILKGVPADLRHSTALFCVGLAVLAGAQDDDAVRKVLERVYKTLGEDPASLWNDLHAISVSGGRVRSKAHDGIDHERVAEIAAETEEAAKLLAGIFREDEPHTPAPAASPAQSKAGGAGDGSFPGLKPALQQLLSRLMGRDTVPEGEFNAMARELGLMPDGAIETINEWSLDRFDIPLIEPNETNIQIEWTQIGALSPAA